LLRGDDVKERSDKKRAAVPGQERAKVAYGRGKSIYFLKNFV
jgi:hypothetical protein